MHHKCGTSSAMLGGQGSRSRVASPSVASDDLEDDIDIDIDVDIDMDEVESMATVTTTAMATTTTNTATTTTMTTTTTVTTLPQRKSLTTPIPKRSTHRQRQQQLQGSVIDPAVSLPINLSGIPIDLPEQTEPEDLSMSTGMQRVICMS